VSGSEPVNARRRTEDNPETVGDKIGGLIKELLIVVVGALIIAFLIRTFLGQMFLIPSGSMEHTLNVSDRIAVQKVTAFHRGSIVVFKDPDHWLGDEPQAPPRGPIGKALEFIGVLPNTSSDYLVKRVIGMPGDHVKCCDNQGRITVNGQPLDERSYLYSQNGVQSKPSDRPFDVIVPRDRLWVMGDHRDDSADSRCHLNDQSVDGTSMSAFVPVDDVVGPVFAIVAPFSRASWIHIPKTFENVPDAKDPPPAAPVIRSHNDACG
jgi:signal peptidase I